MIFTIHVQISKNAKEYTECINKTANQKEAEKFMMFLISVPNPDSDSIMHIVDKCPVLCYYLMKL